MAVRYVKSFRILSIKSIKITRQCILHTQTKFNTSTHCFDKPAFHDTNTDTDILADILTRIVARMSACRSACHRNNSRKSRVSDVSARILAKMSVSVSWNADYNHHQSFWQLIDQGRF